MTTGRRKLAADAWGALLRTHAALVPRLDKRMRQISHLPLAWYDVLLELHDAPEQRLRMSALADRVTLSRTRVSRIVDEMNAAGLLRREGNPDDRRSSYAVLAEPGRTTFRSAAAPYLAAIEEHFAHGLTDREIDQLKTLLDKVCERQIPDSG
ncbi:MAG: MarR family winged helix-turn-helix transcriptional regulator [Nocardioides sp.]